MKNIIAFLSKYKIAFQWTFWYCLILWFILQVIFGFNPFSAHYWWKYQHATLHGFGGFVFNLVIYTAIPIYIATTLTVIRNNEMLIKIPFIEKAFNFIHDKLINKKIEEPTPETSDAEQDSESQIEYPSDMPTELRVPFIRAKKNMPLTGAISVFNKTKDPTSNNEQTDSQNDMPIPLDFDISDSLESNDMPIFKDIDLDKELDKALDYTSSTPVTDKKLTNTATKYFDNKKVKYETYNNFVVTDKYVVYDHNDGDFWIMDEESWFASGKQIDSPIPELLQIAKTNDVIPIIFLESENIMDYPGTVDNFENAGIRVIKSMEELD